MQIFYKRSDAIEFFKNNSDPILELILTKFDEIQNAYSKDEDMDLKSSDLGSIILIEEFDNVESTSSNSRDTNDYIIDENLNTTIFEFVSKHVLLDNAVLYEGLCLYSNGNYFTCYFIPSNAIPISLVNHLETLIST